MAGNDDKTATQVICTKVIARLDHLNERFDEMGVALAKILARLLDTDKKLARLEQWVDDHQQIEHRRIWASLNGGAHRREISDKRLWDVALRVAEIGVIVALLTKMAGVW